MNDHTARPATSADNGGLLALAAACPMRGELTLCVRREPDFFALNRLQGDRWDVGVVDGGRAGVIGCVAIAERLAYVNGAPAPTAYASDLKVHPAFRGRRNGTGRVADALTEYARETLGAIGPHMPVLVTVLGGNAAMAPRLCGPRGLPRFIRFATIRTFAVPLFTLRRLDPLPGLSVRPAEERDLDEMAALWRAVAPLRQLAPVLGTDDFRRVCAEAPGLALSSYWIARHAAGHLVGFVALWDQQQLKHTVVQRYALRAALFRYGFNLVAPLVGSPRLPAPGTPLRYLSAFQVCVPATDPGVLRALLVKAAQAQAGSPYAFCSLGLDVTDPLTSALAGCWAQTTLVHAHVGTPAGPYDGPPLGARPLHFETALV